MRKKTCERNF